MVSAKANKRKTVRKRIFRNILIGLGVIAVFAIGAAGAYFLVPCFVNNNQPTENIAPSTEPQPEPEPTVVLPDRIDFQPVVDSWAQGVSGNRSVLIYDLDRDEVVGEYNPKESYNTASLYKLFVVYEGYRRLQSGEWQADEPVGYTGYTILKCLDLAIRESNSSCAETLWTMIGRQDLINIIENDYSITDSDIASLISNPQDIMKMLKIFYEHKNITDNGLVATMKDSFLNQPPTTYDWRQGLPSGFTKANVYNKVGWDYNPDARVWNIYHDAAIVEFSDLNRHFIVVVMTNRVPFQKITALGKMIEDKVLSSYQ
ncbi:serine hydrolase [Candidatus Saccharibacteria bacterium]|nr:serine hydrolase [Candidatus Saccharibacteria bacterium]